VERRPLFRCEIDSAQKLLDYGRDGTSFTPPHHRLFGVCGGEFSTVPPSARTFQIARYSRRQTPPRYLSSDHDSIVSLFIGGWRIFAYSRLMRLKLFAVRRVSHPFVETTDWDGATRVPRSDFVLETKTIWGGSSRPYKAYYKPNTGATAGLAGTTPAETEWRAYTRQSQNLSHIPGGQYCSGLISHPSCGCGIGIRHRHGNFPSLWMRNKHTTRPRHRCLYLPAFLAL